MANDKPETEAKITNEQQAKRDKENAKNAKDRAEIKVAKEVLIKFKETKEYKAISKSVRDAIDRITRSGSRGGYSGTTIMATIQEMFPKVGTTIHELDVFKKTKWGRGQFRKNIKELIKKTDPKDYMWISFDDVSESWTLRSVGEKIPKDFKQ